MDVSVNPAGQVVCAVFARCENPAAGVITHPVLEYVPACQQCADKMEALGGDPLIPAEFEVTE